MPDYVSEAVAWTLSQFKFLVLWWKKSGFSFRYYNPDSDSEFGETERERERELKNNQNETY